MTTNSNQPENFPAAENVQSAQTPLELINNFLNVPVRKLDADEYVASDIDGVTESLLGSGNMNFLMMQAGQTNEAISNASPFGPVNANSLIASGSGLVSGQMSGLRGDGAATDRALSTDGGQGGGAEAGSSGNGTASTAGSLSASNLAANSQSLSPMSESAFQSSAALSAGGAGAAGGNGPAGQNGANAASNSGANGANGADGTPGGSGADGTDGTPGGGTTIINIDNSVYHGDTHIDLINETLQQTIQNIYNTTTTTATTIVNEAGDVINDIVNNTYETINNAGDTILETVENIYNDTGDLVTTIVNNAGDVVTTTVNNAGDILNTTINNAGDIVNNIVENIFNTVNNPGGTPGPIGLNLDLALDQVTDLNLDLIHGGGIVNIIDETLDTAPILAPVAGIVGDLMSSTSLDVLLNPFQYDGTPGDSDLHLGSDLDLLDLGLPPLDIEIPLDPVEALVGDLDISLDLTNDLLGAPGDIVQNLLGSGTGDTDLGLSGLTDTLGLAPVTDGLDALVNPVEDLVGDVDLTGAVGLGLLGTDTDQGASDTDIALPLDLDLLNTDLGGNDLTISLDPIEQLTGDIDVDLNAAVDLLGAAADTLIDGEPRGTETANPLSLVGDAVASLTGDLLPLSDSGDTDVALETGVAILDQGLLADGASVILNPVENLTGDIDLSGAVGLDLLGNGDHSGTDTDLTLPLDLDLADGNLAGDVLNINLDPLETLTGDIDIDLALAIDALGHSADPLIDNYDGGTASDQDLLSQAGGLLGGVVETVLPFGNDSDTDISGIIGLGPADSPVLGNDLLVGLDPLEKLTGDIDIGTGHGLDLIGDTAPLGDVTLGLADHGIINDGAIIGLDLIPVNPLANIESGTGAVLNLGEGSLALPDANAGIADLTGDINGLLGSLTSTLNDVIETAVSTINAAPDHTGGLDLNALSAPLTVIGGAAESAAAWTDTVLPDAGAALGGGLAAVAAVLPEPVGTGPIAALPAPVLPVVHAATSALGGIGGLGGLGGGNHHHGGLFG